jgi:hypothetical protein
MPRWTTAAIVLALGCAGRNDEVEAPDEPWVMEAEPTVFADAPPNAGKEHTVLVVDVDDAPIEPTAEAAASPIDGLVGDYRYSGGESGRKAVERAIDDVADEMSVVARNIARSRLSDANEVPAHVEIANDGDTITVTIDGKPFTATLGGKSVSVRDQGKRSRLRYTMRDGSLYMTLDGKEGDRINVFTPRKDGTGVVMGVTMRSDKLPQPVKYRLTYKSTS